MSSIRTRSGSGAGYNRTANVLNALPRSLQPQAKQRLQSVWMAPGIEEADKKFDRFLQLYQAKYPKATACLEKDRDVLLTFYSFPAEHWKHIRTTNPIESTFATVRLRTEKVKSCFSSRTVVTMAYKLCRCAEKRWQKINGINKLGKIIKGLNSSMEKRGSPPSSYTTLDYSSLMTKQLTPTRQLISLTTQKSQAPGKPEG